MEDDIKCKLICEGSTKHLKQLVYCFCTLHTYQHMLCIVVIVDYPHGGSATVSFEDLATLHRRTLQEIF